MSLSIIDRTSKQESNKDRENLSNSINQLDPVNIYRKLHTTNIEYTFPTGAHKTFLKIDHILGHRFKVLISLKGFKSYKVFSLTTMESN